MSRKSGSLKRMRPRLAVFTVVLFIATPALGGNLGPAIGRIDQPTLFKMVGNLYGLDPNFLQAIATVESGGDSRAVSPAGAQGLMQLMPATARRFGVDDPFDVVENVFGAARYLDHLRRWEVQRSGNGSTTDVLAAYNAGEKAVEKYGGLPPYAETQDYVRRVVYAYLLSGLINRPLPAVDRGRLNTVDASHRVLVEPSGRLAQSSLRPGTFRRWQPPDLFMQLAQIKCRRESILNGKPSAEGCGKSDAADLHLVEQPDDRQAIH